MGSFVKPLYLDAEAPVTVDLDGPALRVAGGGCADGRYPLKRLSRIVVHGDVEWRARALAACLAAGISISFVDGGGEVTGLCLSTRPRRPYLGQWLNERASMPNWAEYYADWRRRMEREAALRFLGATELGVPSLDPACVRERFVARVRGLGARPLAFLEAAAASLAAEVCQDFGRVSFADCNLVTDLAMILRWEADALAYKLGRKRRHAFLSVAAAASAFEAEREKLEKRAVECLSALLARPPRRGIRKEPMPCPS